MAEQTAPPATFTYEPIDRTYRAALAGKRYRVQMIGEATWIVSALGADCWESIGPVFRTREDAALACLEHAGLPARKEQLGVFA